MSATNEYDAFFDDPMPARAASKKKPGDVDYDALLSEGSDELNEYDEVFAQDLPAPTPAPIPEADSLMDRAGQIVAQGWDSAPVRSAREVVGGVLDVTAGGVGAVAGLGAAALGSDAYSDTLERKIMQRAEEKRARGESTELGAFERLSLAPKVGEMVTGGWTPESTAGQAGKEVADLALTMATDPASWFGAGLAKAAPLARYALGGEKTLARLAPALGEVAGGLDEAVDAVKLAQGISRPRAAVAAAGEALSSPLPALIYAPDIVGGVQAGVEGVEQAYDEGDYLGMLARGGQAALMAGLGGAMARGSLQDARGTTAPGPVLPVRDMTAEALDLASARQALEQGIEFEQPVTEPARFTPEERAILQSGGPLIQPEPYDAALHEADIQAAREMVALGLPSERMAAERADADQQLAHEEAAAKAQADQAQAAAQRQAELDAFEQQLQPPPAPSQIVLPDGATGEPPVDMAALQKFAAAPQGDRSGLGSAPVPTVPQPVPDAERINRPVPKIPLDDVPEPLRAPARDWAKQAAKSYADIGKMIDSADFARSLPPDLRPHSQALLSDVVQRAAALIEGRDHRDSFRESYGNGPDGIEIRPTGGDGAFDIIQRHNGQIEGGAVVSGNELKFIFGGKGLDSPVSISDVYKRLDDLGVKRNDALTVMGAETRAAFQGKAQSANSPAVDSRGVTEGGRAEGPAPGRAYAAARPSRGVPPVPTPTVSAPQNDQQQGDRGGLGPAAERRIQIAAELPAGTPREAIERVAAAEEKADALDSSGRNADVGVGDNQQGPRPNREVAAPPDGRGAGQAPGRVVSTAGTVQAAQGPRLPDDEQRVAGRVQPSDAGSPRPAQPGVERLGRAGGEAQPSGESRVPAVSGDQLDRAAAPDNAGPEAGGEAGGDSLAQLRAEDPHQTTPGWDSPPADLKKRRYGVMVSDGQGNVVLRKPKGGFMGYAWTFARGHADKGEHPVDAALREASEELGIPASAMKITGKLPSGFPKPNGDGTRLYFYVAHVDPEAIKHAEANKTFDAETERIALMDPEQAVHWIGKGQNVDGMARDRAILKAWGEQQTPKADENAPWPDSDGDKERALHSTTEGIERQNELPEPEVEPAWKKKTQGLFWQKNSQGKWAWFKNEKQVSGAVQSSAGQEQAAGSISEAAVGTKSELAPLTWKAHPHIGAWAAGDGAFVVKAELGQFFATHGHHVIGHFGDLADAKAAVEKYAGEKGLAAAPPAPDGALHTIGSLHVVPGDTDNAYNVFDSKTGSILKSNLSYHKATQFAHDTHNGLATESSPSGDATVHAWKKVGQQAWVLGPPVGSTTTGLGALGQFKITETQGKFKITDHATGAVKTNLTSLKHAQAVGNVWAEQAGLKVQPIEATPNQPAAIHPGDPTHPAKMAAVQWSQTAVADDPYGKWLRTKLGGKDPRTLPGKDLRKLADEYADQLGPDSYGSMVSSKDHNPVPAKVQELAGKHNYTNLTKAIKTAETLSAAAIKEAGKSGFGPASSAAIHAGEVAAQKAWLPGATSLEHMKQAALFHLQKRLIAETATAIKKSDGKWWRQSAIVDRLGRPLLVQHASNAFFSKFDTAKSNTETSDANNALGFYFQGSPYWNAFAYKNFNGRYILSIQNPYVVSHGDFSHFKNMPGKSGGGLGIRNRLIALGYDGIRVVGHGDQQGSWLSEWGPDQIIPFNPLQVKAALPLKDAGVKLYSAGKESWSKMAAWLGGVDDAMKRFETDPTHPVVIDSAKVGKFDPDDPNVFHMAAGNPLSPSKSADEYRVAVNTAKPLADYRGRALKVIDVEGTVPAEKVEKFRASPHMGTLAREVAHVYDAVRKVVGAGRSFLGFSLAGRHFGAEIGSGALLNPLRIAQDVEARAIASAAKTGKAVPVADQIRDIADGIIGTIAHEITHHRHREHGDAFQDAERLANLALLPHREKLRRQLAFILQKDSNAVLKSLVSSLRDAESHYKEFDSEQQRLASETEGSASGAVRDDAPARSAAGRTKSGIAEARPPTGEGGGARLGGDVRTRGGEDPGRLGTDATTRGDQSGGVAESAVPVPPAAEPKPKLRPIPDNPEKVASYAAGKAEGGRATGKPPEEFINLDRASSDEDLRKMMSRVADAMPEMLGEAKDYRSWAEAREKAIEAGLTEQDFARMTKAGAVSDHVIEAGRMMRHDAFNDARAAAQAFLKAKAAGSETGDLEVAYERAINKADGVMKSTVRAGAEAGRALAIHRKLAEGLSEEERLYRKLAKDRPGMSDGFLKRLMMTDANDTQALNALIRSEFTPSKRSMAYEFWINGLLSGPPTHLANMLGNSLAQAGRIAEKVFAGGIDAARVAVFGGNRERFIGEAMADLHAIRGGIPKATKAFAASWDDELLAFKNGDDAKVEHAPKIPDKFGGKHIRTPTRLLAASDEFFKAVANTREMAAHAYRQASVEGLKGEARKQRMAEILADPEAHPDIVKAAKAGANYQTFTQKLGRFGSAMVGARDADPSGIAKVIVPFMRTPINIAKYTLERTPLNFIRIAELARKGELQGGQLSEELSKAAMGTMLGMGLAMMASEDMLTGGGPSDQRENEALRKTGWQPYSFHVGDQYVSFQRLEPFSSIAGFAADMVEAEDEKTAGDLVNKVVGSIAENLTSKTFLQGIENAFLMWSDPKRYASQWAKNLEGSVIPAVFGRAAQAIDPTFRETNATDGSALAARIPGLSKMLPARRDGTGEEVQRGGSALERFGSPLARSTEKGEEADLQRALIDADAVPSKPSRTITVPGTQGRKLELTRDEYRILQDADAKASAILRRKIKAPGFKAMPPERQKVYFEGEYRRHREDARKRIMRGVIARFKAQRSEARA